MVLGVVTEWFWGVSGCVVNRRFAYARVLLLLLLLCLHQQYRSCCLPRSLARSLPLSLPSFRRRLWFASLFYRFAGDTWHARQVKEWAQVDATDEALMKALATVGPIAIAIEADQMAFQFYTSGVFTAPCGAKLDHGVLAVGYGTWDDGTDYW